MLPTVEEIEYALVGLMVGKQESEGVRIVVHLTLYTKRQVDAVVEVFKGWKNLGYAIAEEKVTLSIAMEDEYGEELSEYVRSSLSVDTPYVRVAQFKLIDNKINR